MNLKDAMWELSNETNPNELVYRKVELEDVSLLKKKYPWLNMIGTIKETNSSNPLDWSEYYFMTNDGWEFIVEIHNIGHIYGYRAKTYNYFVHGYYIHIRDYIQMFDVDTNSKPDTDILKYILGRIKGWLDGNV